VEPFANKKGYTLRVLRVVPWGITFLNGKQSPSRSSELCSEANVNDLC
jgi:hypothetical protein